MRLFHRTDVGRLGGHDIALVLVPHREQRQSNRGRGHKLLRGNRILVQQGHVDVDVGKRRDLLQLELIFGLVDPVADDLDISMIAQDAVENLVVIVEGNDAVDVPFDLAERQLPQVDRGGELLPSVNVILSRLFVGQTRVYASPRRAIGSYGAAKEPAAARSAWSR